MAMTAAVVTPIAARAWVAAKTVMLTGAEKVPVNYKINIQNTGKLNRQS